MPKIYPIEKCKVPVDFNAMIQEHIEKMMKVIEEKRLEKKMVVIENRKK